MTLNSREKLNGIFAGAAIGIAAAAIGIAAVFGAASQSWVIFVLVAAGLFAVFSQTGQIRSPRDRKRNRRK